MSRRLAVLAVVALTACSSASPSQTPPASPDPSAVLECGDIPSGTCRQVADAASLMLGTAPLAVEELDLPDDEDGLQMVERYLVRLEADAAGDELVEVVRFAGRDNWSVRRTPSPSAGN